MSKNSYLPESDNVDKAFAELGKITSPTKRLLDGTIGDEILSDAIGRKVHSSKQTKHHHVRIVDHPRKR